MKNRTKHLFGILTIAATFAAPGLSAAASGGQWAVTAGFQALRGNYVYSSAVSTVYFSAGLLYRSDRFNFSVNVPVIGQNSRGVVSTGRLFMPNGEIMSRGGDGHMGRHREPQLEERPGSALRFGLGELSAYGEWLLVGGSGNQPSLSLSGQLKVPTASKTPDYGSGRVDYGLGGVVRKSVSPYSFVLNIGYLNLGDPEGIVYRNPVYFGIGAGREFSEGRFVLMAYYEQYSEILSGYTPPRQAFVAAYYRLAPGRTVSAGWTTGFSESSPEGGLLLGLEIGR